MTHLRTPFEYSDHDVLFVPRAPDGTTMSP